MLEINNDTIRITRGDSGFIDMVLLTPTDEIYDFDSQNDEITFFLKPPFNPANKRDKILLKKKLKDTVLELESDDTKYFAKGHYLYDFKMRRTEPTTGKELKETVVSGDFYII